MLVATQIITIGYIPKDWKSNAHGEKYISTGDTDTSNTFELSVTIERDDDALVQKHSVWVRLMDPKTGNWDTITISHSIDEHPGDNWWRDDSELWSTIAEFSSSLTGEMYSISGAQLAGCWRIFNNESSDEDHEIGLGLRMIDSSGGEFDNDGGSLNGKFYLHYTVSFDGVYDDDEEKIIIITDA